MDIGTAKPGMAERARAPHHLIDIRDVTEPMNVAQYAALARSAIDAIAARGRPVLVAGGSGFYLKSFFAPVADDVAVPAGLRALVAARLAAEGVSALVGELRRLNPDGLGSLDLANPRRVSRALERCLASGKSLGQLAAAFGAQPPPYAGWRLELMELTRPPAELDRRIAARAGEMIRGGLVGEVRGLLAAGLKKNPSAARAIGYREAVEALEGRLPMEKLESEIVKNTRALVKKQRTWFKTQLPSDRKVIDLSPG